MKQEIDIKNFILILKKHIVMTMFVLNPTYQYSPQIFVGSLDKFNTEFSTNKTQ
ncbi:hypothetical protein [Bacillus thuringiensis]|uniref:hypothetical protein n=1 Tax=Bacillus thuringiensis TaxID=1428 RepID=UPI0015C50474|nr:hypothetical protein [Bacillus thuringiensis]